MMTIAAKRVVTPEDLLLLQDSINYELVDGSLVERHMGSESSAIALAIGIALGNFIRARRLGHLFTADCGYRCFPNEPDQIRKPDVSFIKTGRLVSEHIPEGYMHIAPDLAVEVLSPGDLAYEVDAKVEQYLAAGVRLVWVVSPRTRSIRIHRPKDAKAGPIGALTESDTISGEDVLPGFECPVAEFFQI
jgi:Uma2 family endonuclease